MSTGSSEEIEEERRLLYVAMTRAKDHLHLLVPQRFYAIQQARSGDRHVYAQPTQFIPESLFDYFERCAWPIVYSTAEDSVKVPSNSPPMMDVSMRARALWR